MNTSSLTLHSLHVQLKLPLFRTAAPSSAQNLVNHLAVYIGQTAIDAVVGEGETRVVDAEKVQNGGVEVMVVGASLRGSGPELVA